MKKQMRVSNYPAFGALLYVLSGASAFVFLLPITHAEGAMSDNSIEATGTIIEGGVECPLVRLDDGRVFSLMAQRHPGEALEPGTRIKLLGQITMISVCQQGEALAVSQWEKLEE